MRASIFSLNMTKKRILIVVIAAVLIVALSVASAVVFGKIKEKREREEFLAAMREYYDAKVSAFAEENKTIGEVDVAFIGDSITDGYDVAAYYPQYKTANRGIGGDTTVGLEERLDVSLFDIKPRAVVMLIGANNMREMFDNYESILIKLRDNLPDSEIVILSLTAMSKEWGRNNALAKENNVKIKELAEKYGYTFIDLFTPLTDVATGELYADMSEDGGHPNAKGYAKITEIITPVLDELLANTGE